MIKSEILRVFPLTSSLSIVDKISDHDELGHTFESRAPMVFFYFSTRKYSYGRMTDLRSLLGSLLVSFIWHGEENFSKIFTYRRGEPLSTSCLDGVDIAPVQTG